MIRPYRPWARLEEQPFLVRIADPLLNTVVFLAIEEETSPGVRERVPRASAFLVGVDDEDAAKVHIYVVTARHCIEETAGRPFFIRVNFEDGTDDKPTVETDWFVSDFADVAVSPLTPSGVGHSVASWQLDQFVEADYTARPFVLAGARGEGGPVPVMVGDEVVFLSLFVQTPGKRVNLPVARFGHIARMPHEPIFFERTGGTRVEVLGYLAECHSWGGHSGAPVLWNFTAQRSREVQASTGEKRVLQLPFPVLGLLGLVSGHFDIEQQAKTEGEVLGRITAKLNVGMAVVTPAEAIRQLLMREDVVADRKKRSAEADEKRPTATFDSGFMPTIEGTEFERFEDLTRYLVTTPKPETQKESEG